MSMLEDPDVTVDQKWEKLKAHYLSQSRAIERVYWVAFADAEKHKAHKELKRDYKIAKDNGNFDYVFDILLQMKGFMEKNDRCLKGFYREAKEQLASSILQGKFNPNYLTVFTLTKAHHRKRFIYDYLVKERGRGEEGKLHAHTIDLFTLPAIVCATPLAALHLGGRNFVDHDQLAEKLSGLSVLSKADRNVKLQLLQSITTNYRKSSNFITRSAESKQLLSTLEHAV